MSPTVRKFKVAFLLPHLCSEAKNTTFSFLRVPGMAGPRLAAFFSRPRAHLRPLEGIIFPGPLSPGIWRW